MPDPRENLGLTIAVINCMANQVTWGEMLTVMTEAEVRDRDAITLESYRWQLLEASARLSTTKLIIAKPSTMLDATEAALLRPLEAPHEESTGDPLARLIADLGPRAARLGRRTR